MKTTTVQATVDDPFAGAIRLLADAQRFGWGLLSLIVDGRGDADGTLRLTLSLPPDVEESAVIARLGRHPVVRCIKPLNAAGAMENPSTLVFL